MKRYIVTGFMITPVITEVEADDYASAVKYVKKNKSSVPFSIAGNLTFIPSITEDDIRDTLIDTTEESLPNIFYDEIHDEATQGKEEAITDEDNEPRSVVGMSVISCTDGEEPKCASVRIVDDNPIEVKGDKELLRKLYSDYLESATDVRKLSNSTCKEKQTKCDKKCCKHKDCKSADKVNKEGSLFDPLDFFFKGIC